jgi:hypothetical protein
MVKVVPNMARVKAKVRDIRSTDDPNTFDAKLDLLSSEPIDDYQDLVGKFVGKTIDAKIIVKNKEALTDSGNFLIKYEGDEHGGAFYAQEQ